jgi:hypothetical protein
VVCVTGFDGWLSCPSGTPHDILPWVALASMKIRLVPNVFVLKHLKLESF